MPIRRWTREEIIVALNLYCKIPFKDSHATHPLVIEYANLIGRTPAAMNLKIGNLGRLDPLLRAKGIVGLSNGSKLDEEVWNEFFENPEKLAFESEQIIARLRGLDVVQSTGIDVSSIPEGEDRMVVTRQRVNQRFFRDVVLSSYNNRCCVSGVCNPSLLDACHISSWSDDITNRTNPKNGLCMNVFFHKAFDSFLFTITPDLTISISDQLIDSTMNISFQEYLVGLNNKPMLMPEKFSPDIKLLEIHYNQYLKISKS